MLIEMGDWMMAKVGVAAAERAGRAIASDKNSKVLRGAVWQELRPLRDSATAVSSGKWTKRDGQASTLKEGKR